MKKVLLIYPEFEKTFWGWKFLLKFVGKLAAFISLPLLTVAALFPMAWSKKLIDLNVRNNKSIVLVIWEIFLKLFGIKPKEGAYLITDEELEQADIIAISGMVGQGNSIKEIIARCVDFGREIWLGGSILETEEMCDEFPGVTRFCIGKGERVVSLMTDDYQRGVARRIYNAEEFEFPSINESPIPLYELVGPRYYSAGAVQDSWACPHECEYCKDRIVDGLKWQQKNIEQFLAELDALYGVGFRGAIQIFSANFIGNIKKAKALLRKVIEWQIAHGYPFEFTVEASILITRDQELMDLMVKAGIKKVFLGLETCNDACLRECRKWQNIGVDLAEAVRKIHQAGLIPMSGYMVGFDSDDPQTFADDMIDFIQATCVIAMVGTVQAQPGAPLWDRLVQTGRHPWRSRSNTAFLPNFPTIMDSKILAAGFVKILETIYSPRKYYERIRSFRQDYGILNRPPKKLSFTDFVAFMRANFWIGLLGGPQLSCYYWKSLLETLLSEKRRAFADVVAFWIYEFHFKRATGEEVKKAEAWLASQAD